MLEPMLGGRVLVVDDSELAADVIAELLTDHGLDARVAYDGATALETVRAWSPALVVCDFHMPGMNGLEVRAHIGELDPLLPVVMLTGDDDVNTVLQAVHAGIFDFIPKSGVDSALIAAVRRGLEHEAITRENQRLTQELRLANAELERRVQARTAALLDTTRQLEESYAALHAREARFRSLVQNASDIIAVVDRTGTLTYETPASQAILGIGPDERVGTNVFEAILDEDRDLARSMFDAALGQPGSVQVTKLRFLRRDGTCRWLETCLTSLVHDPNVGGIVWNCRDVTDRHALEERLAHEATHDPLTQLANRQLFRRRLSEAVEAAREGGPSVVVLYIDLDDFKKCNDTLGHAAGDVVLVEVAARLRRAVRHPRDVVARLGGDEFAVVLRDVDLEIAQRIAQRVVDSIGRPFTVQAETVLLRTSVGVATMTDEHDGYEALVRDADIAMYEAKSSGKGRYVVCHSSLRTEARRRRSVEADLQFAIAGGAIRAAFQPIVDLVTGRVIAVEALARWDHPDRGTIPPATFVALAEATGQIPALGERILDEACAALRRWHDLGLTELRVNVNVSPRQLRPDLVDTVRHTLERHRIRPDAVVLEITESAAIDREAEILHALRSVGVSLAIDDFGTGWASLAHLRDLPFDGLKLHGTFVARVTEGCRDAELAQAVIRLGHALGLTVTAEWVETNAQMTTLRDIGCDLGQGYWFARPSPAQALTDLLLAGPVALRGRT